MAEALDPIITPRIEKLVHQLLSRAHKAELTLATAESCTGGLLASLLTDIPNLSHVFERGFVTYTDEAKAELLGVPADILSGPGAVSAPCAHAMAAGALSRSRAQVALSITGWAEAGPDPDKPAGLVYFGCAREGRSPVVREERFGDIGRARLRVACLEVSLEMMLAAVEDLPRAA